MYQTNYLNSFCMCITHSFTLQTKILITRYSTAFLLCLFVILRITQVLISSVEILPYYCAVLYSLIASQYFLLPPLAPHRTVRTVSIVDITTWLSREHSLTRHVLYAWHLSNVTVYDLLLLAHCGTLSIIFTY